MACAEGWRELGTNWLPLLGQGGIRASRQRGLTLCTCLVARSLFANMQLRLTHEIEDSGILSRGAAREPPGKEELLETRPHWNQLKQLTQTWRGLKLLFWRDFWADCEVLWRTIPTR